MAAVKTIEKMMKLRLGAMARTFRELLVEQVIRMVRWRETVLLFKEREVEEVVEAGAGRVLASLVKRIDRELPAISVGTAAETEALMKRL